MVPAPLLERAMVWEEGVEPIAALKASVPGVREIVGGPVTVRLTFTVGEYLLPPGAVTVIVPVVGPYTKTRGIGRDRERSRPVPLLGKTASQPEGRGSGSCRPGKGAPRRCWSRARVWEAWGRSPLPR